MRAILYCAAAAAAIACATAALAQNDPIKLKISYQFPEHHFVTVGCINPLIKGVEEQFRGASSSSAILPSNWRRRWCVIRPEVSREDWGEVYRQVSDAERCMPYKVNQERRHRIPKARCHVKNWRDYDAALRRRGDLTVWVTAEAIEAWTPETTGRRGRPQRYSEMVVETGLMLRLAFGRPWRQTEGMLASIPRLLGLDLPLPDHTTSSRRSVDLTVAKAVRIATGPMNVVIDSTGLQVFGAGEWQRERHGRDGAHPARPAPPYDPRAWSARLAKGGELRPSVLGRGGNDALQDRDWSPPPRPDSAGTKD